MLYVGFALRDNMLARNLVGGLGVVYLLVGILGFIVPNLFGLLPTGYNLADNLLHLALGLSASPSAGSWGVRRPGASPKPKRRWALSWRAS